MRPNFSRNQATVQTLHDNLPTSQQASVQAKAPKYVEDDGEENIRDDESNTGHQKPTGQFPAQHRLMENLRDTIRRNLNDVPMDAGDARQVQDRKPDESILPAAQHGAGKSVTHAKQSGEKNPRATLRDLHRYHLDEIRDYVNQGLDASEHLIPHPLTYKLNNQHIKSYPGLCDGESNIIAAWFEWLEKHASLHMESIDRAELRKKLIAYQQDIQSCLGQEKKSYRKVWARHGLTHLESRAVHEILERSQLNLSTYHFCGIVFTLDDVRAGRIAPEIFLDILEQAFTDGENSVHDPRISPKYFDSDLKKALIEAIKKGKAFSSLNVGNPPAMLRDKARVFLHRLFMDMRGSDNDSASLREAIATTGHNFFWADELDETITALGNNYLGCADIEGREDEFATLEKRMIMLGINSLLVDDLRVMRLLNKRINDAKMDVSECQRDIDFFTVFCRKNNSYLRNFLSPNLDYFLKSDGPDKLQRVLKEQRLATPVPHDPAAGAKLIFDRLADLRFGKPVDQINPNSQEYKNFLQYANRYFTEKFKDGRFEKEVLACIRGDISDYLAQVGKKIEANDERVIAIANMFSLMRNAELSEAYIKIQISGRLRQLFRNDNALKIDELSGLLKNISFEKYRRELLKVNLKEVLGVSEADITLRPDSFNDLAKYCCDWKRLDNDIMDQENSKIYAKVLAAEEFYKGTPLYFDFVFNTLPFRSYKNILGVKKQVGAEKYAREFDLIDSHFKSSNGVEKEKEANEWIKELEGEIEKEESLGLSVVYRKDGNPVLLSASKLAALNRRNFNVREVKEEDLLAEFALISKQQDGTVNSDPITLKSMREHQFPAYFLNIVRTRFTTANIVGKSISEKIMPMLKREHVNLPPDLQEMLENTIYQVSVNLGGKVNNPVSKKEALMEALKDLDFLVMFTEINAEVSNKIGLVPAKTLEELLIDAVSNSKSAPLKAINNDINPLAQEVLEALKPALPAELQNLSVVWYVLGSIFVNLSNADALGYHAGPDPLHPAKETNRAFSRFRLIGAYCLAQCLDAGKSTLSQDEKVAIRGQINRLVSKNDCSVLIGQKLYGTNAIAAIHTRHAAKKVMSRPIDPFIGGAEELSA